MMTTTNEPMLAMRERRLADFLWDNCKDLDSEIVRHFLNAVRAKMKEDN